MASAAQQADFVAGLRKLTVGQVWPRPKQHIVHVKASDTVGHALSVLQDAGVLSVPVFEPDNTILGVLDTLDIALAVVGLAPKDAKWESLWDDADALAAMFDAGEKFETTLVSTVLELKAAWKIGYQHDFVFGLDTPLEKLLDAFDHSVHRVLITDADGSLFNIISATDMAAVVAQAMPLMDASVRAKKVANVLAAEPKLHAASASKPAIRIFTEDMNASSTQASFSAVPLVDDAGRIAGTLSASNLLGVDHRTFDDLALPAIEFVQRRNMGSGSFRSALAGHKALCPITTTADELLEVALARMLAARVHRLWVVNPENKPVGVVTFGDVFKAFLPY
jgi:5'-AMP-activated protein kinase, regulatory gamma subunit